MKALMNPKIQVSIKPSALVMRAEFLLLVHSSQGTSAMKLVAMLVNNGKMNAAIGEW